MDSIIAFSLPDIQTLLTAGGALLLGGFTIALALSCQAHDVSED